MDDNYVKPEEIEEEKKTEDLDMGEAVNLEDLDKTEEETSQPTNT